MEALFAEIHPVFQKNDHTAAELLLYPQGFQQDTPQRRPRDLHGARRRPVQAGHRGLPARAVGGPLHHQRRLHRLGLQHQGRALLHARGHAGRGPGRHRLRVPRLRAADPAGVPPPPAVRARPREVGRRPVRARLAPRQHGRRLHRRHVRRVLRRPAARGRGRQAQARRRPDPLQGQRRRRRRSPRRRSTPGGERYYKDPGVYYHRVRGYVVGTKPGDSVEVWFTAGGKASAHFTYSAAVESTKPVLILSNEDYSGVQPKRPVPADRSTWSTTPPRSTPRACSTTSTTSTRTAAARPTRSGSSPTTRTSSGTRATTTSRASPTRPAARASRRWRSTRRTPSATSSTTAASCSSPARTRAACSPRATQYNPFQAEEHTYCQDANPSCIVVQDDFLQYYLGAYRYVGGGGEDDDGDPFPVAGHGRARSTR